MEGWFEGQMLDYIHDNAKVMTNDEIDSDIMEANGQMYGCVSTKTVLHEERLRPRRRTLHDRSFDVAAAQRGGGDNPVYN